MTSRPVKTVSELCLACGLCCDGSLFGFVALSDEEAERLRGHGLTVDAKGERLGLRLRCGGLQGRCCSLYGERPQGCRTFVCTVARRFEAQALTGEEAMNVVSEAQARIAALGQRLDPPRASDVMQAVRDGQADPQAPFSDSLREEARDTQRFVAQHFFGWS